MKWMLFILAVLGFGIYFGYLPRPFGVSAGRPASWKNSFTGPPAATKQVSPPIGPALHALAEGVLQPLDSPRAISPKSAREILESLRTQLAAESTQPAAARHAQILALLEQASAERDAVIAKLMAKSPNHTLDAVPGDWHVPGHPEKKVDLTALNQQWRASFWAQIALAQWRTRCEQYRQTVEMLFAQLAPGASERN